MKAKAQAAEENTVPLNPQQQVPQPGKRRKIMTASKPASGKSVKRTVVTVLMVLVILAILAVTIYFVKVLVDSKYFFCYKSWRFIPLEEACDGKKDCSGGEDELNCVSSFKPNTTFPLRIYSESQVLQVYSSSDGTWRSVCADNFTQQHAVTFCQQLGYTLNPFYGPVQVGDLSSDLQTSFCSVGSSTPLSFLSTVSSTKVCGQGAVVTLSCSDCGKSLNADRIVGGQDAVIENWPWQISLQVSGQHTCGGSLVAPNWVVTAAHCFNGDGRKELTRWTVVSGNTYLTSFGGSAVDKIFVNGNYNPTLNDYDIAIIKLQAPITVGETRRPVCLPPQNLGLQPGSNVVVTGWGDLKENGDLSSNLQKVQIPVVDPTTCSSPDVYGSSITPRMICAGLLTGGVDACQGDSGGPLVYSSSRWVLVGVVSWGVGCARAGFPGVYTNVDQMLDWIHSVMLAYK